jgi:hypothetical protein
VAEAEETSGKVVEMVWAVPTGEISMLCRLAVEHDYRKGLGA